MMNEEKQPVDVSKQPIVFGGYISFSIIFLSTVVVVILMYSKQLSFSSLLFVYL